MWVYIAPCEKKNCVLSVTIVPSDSYCAERSYFTSYDVILALMISYCAICISCGMVPSTIWSIFSELIVFCWLISQGFRWEKQQEIWEKRKILAILYVVNMW